MARHDIDITDEQIIALRLAAQHHLEIGATSEREQARSILIWCNEAFAGTRNSREARAICFRALNNGTIYMSREMRETYARAYAGATAVLPPAPLESERTAFASRGYENGAPFLVVGVRVMGETAVQLPVQGSHDRVTALRFLEMHLLQAAADVRALRAEIEDEERKPAPQPFARMERS